MEMIACPTCGAEYDGRRVGGQCNPCRRAVAREYFQEYRERIKEHRQGQREHGRIYAHRCRARKLGCDGSHTRDELRQQRERQGDKCFYCSTPLDSWDHLEHKIPLSRGGSDSIENIVFACAPCNRKKGTKTADEFMALSA